MRSPRRGAARSSTSSSTHNRVSFRVRGVAATSSSGVRPAITTSRPRHGHLPRYSGFRRGGADQHRRAGRRALQRVHQPRKSVADPGTQDRIRHAARSAQGTWSARPCSSERPLVPYFPNVFPTSGRPDVGPGWAWGVTTAIGVASAAADLLRRLVWVLGEIRNGGSPDARRTVSNLSTQSGPAAPTWTTSGNASRCWRRCGRTRLLASAPGLLRAADGGVSPDADAESELEGLIKQVIAEQVGDVDSPRAERQLRAALDETVQAERGTVGTQVRSLVNQVVELVRLSPCPRYCAGPTSSRSRSSVSTWRSSPRWRRVLRTPTPRCRHHRPPSRGAC